MPMTAGLAALDRMRLDPQGGHPVLADHLRGELYVLVLPRTFPRVEVPGVRVLSSGIHLVLPRTADGSETADWLSAPRGERPPLVRADRLAGHLQALLDDRREVAAR
ncbi:hypothetical protein ACH4U6_10015 [Streptomyces netropsis]|uniref:hypothetical protein n=1 Tax=Streptomyces netropsis TaxID=55404 RepID=UPI0037A73215